MHCFTLLVRTCGRTLLSYLILPLSHQVIFKSYHSNIKCLQRLLLRCGADKQSINAKNMPFCVWHMEYHVISTISALRPFVKCNGEKAMYLSMLYIQYQMKNHFSHPSYDMPGTTLLKPSSHHANALSQSFTLFPNENKIIMEA